MERMRIPRAIIFLVTLASVAGCKTVEKHPDEASRSVDTVGHADAFHATLPPGATLDTVMAADLDGRGRSEYVVTSRDTSMMHGIGRASRVEIFAFDSVAR